MWIEFLKRCKSYWNYFYFFLLARQYYFDCCANVRLGHLAWVLPGKIKRGTFVFFFLFKKLFYGWISCKIWQDLNNGQHGSWKTSNLESKNRPSLRRRFAELLGSLSKDGDNNQNSTHQGGLENMGSMKHNVNLGHISSIFQGCSKKYENLNWC